MKDKKDLGIESAEEWFQSETKTQRAWGSLKAHQSPTWQARGKSDGLPTSLMANWNGSYIDMIK